MHAVGQRALVEILRVVNPEERFGDSEGSLEQADDGGDDSEKKEEPENDEDVLVTDVLADLAYDFVSRKITKETFTKRNSYVKGLFLKIYILRFAGNTLE